jgi:hypothetical protein
LPYAAALSLVRDVPRLTQPAADVDVFIDGVGDPEVLRLQELVEFEHSSILDEENEYTMDSIVEITDCDGNQESSRTSYSVRAQQTGASKNAIAFDHSSSDDVQTKFRNLCNRVLTSDEIDAFVRGIGNLEHQEDVDQLLSLVVPTSPLRGAP